MPYVQGRITIDEAAKFKGYLTRQQTTQQKLIRELVVQWISQQEKLEKQFQQQSQYLEETAI
jgi:hypothetical protein